MPTKIIGTAPYQVPRNADLGTLAVQDADSINIQGGAVTLGASSTQGYFQNTDVSDIKPSLLLDFANGKSLDPRITFNRSTSATYYDGKTYAKGDENLIKYTSNFSLASTYGNMVFDSLSYIPNDAIAPDGSMTAGRIIVGSGDVYHRNYVSGIPAITGTTYTASVYAKPNGYNYLHLRVDDGAGILKYGVCFNVSTGAITQGYFDGSQTLSSPVSSSCTSVGNGWYRCVVTWNVSSYNTTAVLLQWSSSATITTPAGDGSAGFYVWGLQLEQRSSATAYVATTSQPITTWFQPLVTASSYTPRFDHDPVTAESKGLLFEESRTNLFTYSSAFDNAIWTKYGCSVTSNSTVAPDGTVTAQKLVTNTANSGHYMYQAVNCSLNTPYTYSVFLKAGELTTVAVDMSDNVTGDANVTVDLTNGTIISTAQTGSWTNVSGTVTPVGNGWYRCSVTGTRGANTPASIYSYVNLLSGNADTFLGNGWSGIYVWGAQIEQGTFATSYIATTSSSTTRGADYAYMLGVNFSSWYNTTEGTFNVEAKLPILTSQFKYFVQVDSGTSGNRIAITTNYGIAERFLMATVGNYDVDITKGSNYSANTQLKMAGAYKLNDYAYASSGSLVAVDTSGAVPNCTALRIGCNQVGTENLNGWITKIVYYPKRLSNAELLEITL